jgi:hypothetical protein
MLHMTREKFSLLLSCTSDLQVAGEGVNQRPSHNKPFTTYSALPRGANIRML